MNGERSDGDAPLEGLCGRLASQLARLRADIGLTVARATSDHLLALVHASDTRGRKLHELQLVLADSQGNAALREHQPRYLPDVPAAELAWPEDELTGLGIGALFLLPLQLGAATVGLASVYADEPLPLTQDLRTRLARQCDLLSWVLLLPTLPDDAGSETASPEAVLLGSDLAAVHQAAGMTMAQLGGSIEDALALLHARAYSSGRSVAALAHDIVGRRLRFDAPHEAWSELSEPHGGSPSPGGSVDADEHDKDNRGSKDD